MTLGTRLLIILAATFSLALAFSPAGTAFAADCDGDGVDDGKQCVEVCHGTECAAADNFIETYLNPIVYVLTALVGITAVISIIYAGIQYSTSADDPGTVTKAKQRIFNVVLGLVAYIFLLALLNYLIPGGVF